MNDKTRSFEWGNLPCFNCGQLSESCQCTTPIEDLKAIIAALVEALEAMLNMYVQLADSGDAGFWDPEAEDEVIQARAALKLAKSE